MVKVQNISKAFGTTKAVDDISFEVDSGEILGFLGPNGAGKTTTMRMMAGYLSADTGTITVDGIAMEKNPIEGQKRIGYLPENNPLYKDMLVSEMLELSADLKHIAASDRKKEFDFVVEAVGIAEVFYKPVRELSKGYKQRLGIAIALLSKPPVIILDEPTEGLDPNQRTEIRGLIKKLARQHTIIVSTHVMQEASAICNRLLIINKGKIVADGTADKLSRLAQQKRIITIDIEGSKVESLLSGMEAIKEMEVRWSKGDRLQAHLTVLKTSDIQPEISQLAHKHNWTIWKIYEEERNLEDIFHQLTNE